MSTGVALRSKARQNVSRGARGDLLFDLGKRAASETSLAMLHVQV